MTVYAYHYEPNELTPYDETQYNNVKRFSFDSNKNTLFLVYHNGETDVIEHNHRIVVQIREA